MARLAIWKSRDSLVSLVEQRLPTSSISRLLDLGITRDEVDKLVIPLRTLQHRRSRREKLTIEESDRVMRVLRLLSSGESVYGSRERALAWLRRRNPRLRGRAPCSRAVARARLSDCLPVGDPRRGCSGIVCTHQRKRHSTQFHAAESRRRRACQSGKRAGRLSAGGLD